MRKNESVSSNKTHHPRHSLPFNDHRDCFVQQCHTLLRISKCKGQYVGGGSITSAQYASLLGRVMYKR